MSCRWIKAADDSQEGSKRERHPEPPPRTDLAMAPTSMVNNNRAKAGDRSRALGFTEGDVCLHFLLWSWKNAQKHTVVLETEKGTSTKQYTKRANKIFIRWFAFVGGGFTDSRQTETQVCTDYRDKETAPDVTSFINLEPEMGLLCRHSINRDNCNRKGLYLNWMK